MVKLFVVRPIMGKLFFDLVLSPGQIKKGIKKYSFNKIKVISKPGQIILMNYFWCEIFSDLDIKFQPLESSS